MWSPSGNLWRVGLSARRLVRVQHTGRWPVARLACDRIACHPQAGEEPWRAVVATLADLLAREQAHAPVIQGVLSGAFVRWQLIPRQDGLTRHDEIAAYARACFADTYGAVVDNWTILHALQPPGRPTPACAVDAELMAALQAACAQAGARLDLVTPYFASAADHWRKSLRRGTAWLGLIEEDCLSLGLLHEGQWLALHSRRVHGDGIDHLPGMMAQLSLSVGLTGARPVLYLAGDAAVPPAQAGLPFVWLDPAIRRMSGDAGYRMATGS